MNEERDHAKENVILLMQRERELFAMRMKHEQVAQWLKVTQALGPMFEPALSVLEIYGRLRKALLAGLRLQRVSFFELGAGSMQALAPAGAARSVDGEVTGFLAATPSGFCNEPDESGVRALADAVGLQRFFWSVIRVATAAPVLLAAGFEPSKSANQSPFDESAAAHIDNTAQHIASMFENHRLVRQLKVEKDGLEQANLALQRRDEELEAVDRQLRLANETLERRVSERTAELGHRNRDLHLVLDNVDQAFLTIDARGRLARERSAAVDRWFGSYVEDSLFSDYIGSVDARFATSFALSYEALLEGVLPHEVCLSQIPSRLRDATSEYSCNYFMLRDGDAISGLVIVISDVTEQARRTKSEAEHAELLALFQCFIRDRAGYLTFVGEADLIVQQLDGDALDSSMQKRLLHTLKGNAASIMGSNVVAGLCHTAEEQLSGDTEGSASTTILALRARWSAIRLAMCMVDDETEYRTLDVPLEQIAHLHEEIRAGQNVAALARVAFWQSEPVLQPLERLAKVAEDLALRLGKGQIDVRLSAPELRLDFQKWSSVWAGLVHVVRNAVDHGFESPDERARAEKPQTPMLALRFRRDPRECVIEIEDDGRGIEWQRVRLWAQQHGLPHDTEDDLRRALFAPGLSTKGEVTMTSGRGIGMSAIQAEVEALGGAIHVSSRPRTGTCWSFSFPVSERLPVYSVRPSDAANASRSTAFAAAQITITERTIDSPDMR